MKKFGTKEDGSNHRTGNGARFDGNAAAGELLYYLLPLIGSGFFQQFYSLFSTAAVSRSLSMTAVSVMGACAAAISMQSFITGGLTNGFGMYLTRCYGEDDGSLYRKSFTAARMLLWALTAASLVFAFEGAGFLMDLMRVPEELREVSGRYLTIMILGTGFLGLKNLLLRTLEGMGRSAISGMAASCSVVLQTVLLLLGIFLLRLDVSAAALAVLVNNGLLSLILLMWLHRNCPELMVWELPSREEGKVWRELLMNGGAKSSMMILVGLGNFVMQGAINTLPAEQIAGYAYADNLSNFLMVPLCALATAAFASAGQNTGRKDYDRVRLYHRKLLIGHLGCTAALIALTVLCGRDMIRLLAGSSAPESAIEAGTLWLLICIPAFLGLGVALIGRNTLQVMGGYGKLVLLGVLEMSVTILFAAFAVPVGGYLAVCLSIAVKWSLLGIAAGWWCWRRMQKLAME